MFIANLSGADLLNATGPPSSVESAACDINTNLTGTLFDQVAAGWAVGKLKSNSHSKSGGFTPFFR